MKQSYYRPESWLPQIVIKEQIKDVLKLAKSNLKKPLKEITVLDVGSGFGVYSKEIAKRVKEVVGVEPFKMAYLYARSHNKVKNVKLVNCLIEKFKTSKRFDLVMSLTTLEHMPHADKSFKNIFKLMKKGGIIYLTAPNKLWPFDYHYKLPFLTWLPLPIANFYVRITRRGQSFADSCYSMTYWGVKRFLNEFDCSYKFILPDPNSKYIGCGDSKGISPFIQKAGIYLISKFPFLWAISKGFIILVKKR